MERLNYVTISTTRAKHRAARRPISQVIVDAAGDNLSTAGKRTVAVAATSGLLVSMLGTSASAAADSKVSIGTADVSALTSQARAQLQAAPAVTVADASWSVSAAKVKPVKVKPAPEVRETVEAPRTNEAASRSQARTAVENSNQSAVKTEKKTAPPAAASGSAVIEIASRYVGVPYVYGGTTPNGFDCSGFTSYVYAQVGINLPRSSGAQRSMGTVIPRSQAKPGDLIWTPGHVAIYAGGNTQIDSPRPGKTIQVRSIWQSNPTFIRLG